MGVVPDLRHSPVLLALFSASAGRGLHVLQQGLDVAAAQAGLVGHLGSADHDLIDHDGR